MKISVIIPSKDDFKIFNQTFNSVINQKLLPDEIIIVDSSKDNKIENYLNDVFSKINIRFIKVNNKYPGEARNIGIRIAKHELIAFLDSKTIPSNLWLKDFNEKIVNEQYDIVFGTTKYIYKTNTQKKIRAATFGNKFHLTTPGTLIKKTILMQNNFFIEQVRTADDLEWRLRLIKKKYKIYKPNKQYLTYESLPNNIFALLKRYFIYSFHTAQVNVDNKLKFLYFILTTTLFLLIVPKWNQYIPGWSSSHPLYINNHLKIIILLFITSFIIIFVIQNIKFKYLNHFFKLILIILSILLIYNWNFLIADWVEKSIFYVPHITKLYIFSLLLTSFLIRGIFYPIKRNISKKFLFPYNWILIGIYGFLIDIVKTPGYFLGAILPRYFKKNPNKFYRSLVFYPKYGEQSPSYRVRFLSYIKFLKAQGIEVQSQILFDKKFYNNRIFNNKINYIKILYFYIIRIWDLSTRPKPFLAIAHIEFLPFVPFIVEIILRLRRIPYCIDIDDSVYIRYLNSNKFLYFFDFLKFKYSLKNASRIFVGNNFHYKNLNKYNKNTFYLPTVIDIKKYSNYILNNKYNRFTIVWIGTPSTTKYLKEIVPILNNLVDEFNIDIKLIGADLKQIKDLNCEVIEWQNENELEILSKCHMGIMPLHNTSWELGKCAYKILQYMALQLPVVASPIGANKEIIIDSKNGFLAENNSEWYKKIKLVINDKDLRNKISINGYNTVVQDFNLENFKFHFFNYIAELN